MLRRVPATEHARVRTLRAPPVLDVATVAQPYRADAARLRALLLAELTCDLSTLVGALVARLGDADHVTLHAHPDDLPQLEAIDTHIVRVADASLSRGGCRVHGVAGVLDATVETRITRLLAAAEVTP